MTKKPIKGTQQSQWI